MWRTFLQKAPKILHQILPPFGASQLVIPNSFHHNPACGQERITLAVMPLLIRMAVAATVQFDA